MWSGRDRGVPSFAKPARVAIIGASGTYGKGNLARAEQIGVEVVGGAPIGMGLPVTIEDPSGVDNLRRVTTRADIDALSIDTEAVFVVALDDDKAQALGRLERLRVLYQDGNSSRLTDKGLEAISRISSLELLDLEWSAQLTDTGLSQLQKLQQLEWIDLGGCSNISDAGIAALKEALPRVEIDR